MKLGLCREMRIEIHGPNNRNEESDAMRKSRTWRPGAHRGFCLLFLIILLLGCGRAFRNPPEAGANTSTVGQQLSPEGKASLEGYDQTLRNFPICNYPNFFNNLRTGGRKNSL